MEMAPLRVLVGNKTHDLTLIDTFFANGASSLSSKQEDKVEERDELDELTSSKRCNIGLFR